MLARALTLIACGLALGAGSLRAAEPAADLPKGHLDGYIAMVNADRARDRGQYKTAVQSYREALLRYQQVARDNPQWHPEIVQYRTAYCTSQIENLVKQSGKTEAELLGEADAAAEGDLARARAKYADLVKQHADGMAQLAELQRTVKQMQGDVLARDGEIARLREEINRARDQLLASTNTMATANQLAQNVVASLEEENKRLKRDVLAQADAGKLAAQEYLRLQAELETLISADAKLREEHAAATTRLGLLEKQGKASADDLAALRKEADDLRARDIGHAAELRKRDAQIEQLKGDAQKLAGDRNASSAAQAQVEKLAAQSARDLEAARNELANTKAQLATLEQKHRVAQGDVDRLAAAEAKAREDLNAAAKRRDEVTADLARVRADAEKTAAELAALRQQQGAREAQLAGWEKEKAGLTQELVRAQSDARRFEGDLAAARKLQSEREAAFGSWSQDRVRLTQDLARVQAELSAAQGEAAAARAQRGEAEKAARELAKVRDQLAAAQQESGQRARDLEAVQADYRKAAGELEPLKAAAQERRAEEDKRKAELAKRDAEIADLKKRVKEATDVAESRTSMHEALLANFEGTRKRLADVMAQLEASEASGRGAQSERDAAKADLAKARDAMQAAEKRAVSLTEAVDARGRELAESQQAAEQLKKDVKQLRAELEKAADTIARQDKRLKSQPK